MLYKHQYNNNLVNDIELIDNIFFKIDNTVTLYGKKKLKQYLTLQSVENLPFLLNINNSIKNDNQYIKKITKYLKYINTFDNDLDYWFSSKTDNELYFDYDLLNNSLFLNFSNKIKFSNMFITILLYFCSYFIFNYYFEIPLSVNSYINSIYTSYKFTSKLILSSFLNEGALLDSISIILVYCYILYQCYGIYNSINNCFIHYNKCANFDSKYYNLNKFLDTVKNIHNNDKYLKSNIIIKYVKKLKKIFSSNSDLGYNLVSKLNYQSYKKYFNKILNYIGTIDVRIMVANLLNNDYTLPNISFDSKNPFIICKNMWHPIIGKNNSIKNDFCIKDNNVSILTGPNQAGKSTFMRSIMTCLVLSQSLGISCCDYIYFTPFNKFYTYINIPDSIGRESLFEAETNRCFEYLNKINKNYFSFGIIDELFTGTESYSGMSCTKAVIENIKKFKNSISIISTHFTQICDIKDVNYLKFIAKKNNDGSFTFPYKVIFGISDQNIAIDLLKQKGYNMDIINLAESYLLNFKS